MSELETVDRLNEDLADEYSYTVPPLPADDTAPDDHNNGPKPCIQCQREPLIDIPVKTTNRALDEVNGRITIEPVCDGHDRTSTNYTVWRSLAYGEADFLAGNINAGIVSEHNAFKAIKTGPTEDYHFISDDHTHTPRKTSLALFDALNED